MDGGRRNPEPEHVEPATLDDGERRFRAVVDHFPFEFILYGPDLRFRYVNEAGRRMAGLTVDEIVGLRDEDIFGPEITSAFLPSLREAQRSKRVVRLEWETPPRLGGRAILVTYVPVLGEDGELRELAGIVIDVTELRSARARAEAAESAATEARRAAECAADEARRSAALQERMMAVVGHDLRTPVSAIRISADVLAGSKLLPEKLLAAVSRVRLAASRIEEIIQKLLDVARVRAGRGIPVELAPLDLAELTARVVDELRLTHPARELGLAHVGRAPARGDAGRLAQAVSNLVSNALQHGDPTGPVNVSIATAGGELQVEVSNRGEPLAPEELERVFEPFERGAASLAARRPGLGLGLFIAREVARAHGGELRVRSSAVGTTFTFALPRNAR